MNPFNWNCEHCGHDQVVNKHNCEIADVKIENMGRRHGPIYGVVGTIVCANEHCQELTLVFQLHHMDPDGQIINPPIRKWILLPESKAKRQPNYIPQPIVSNYMQACSIIDLSPNASAVMSRRCLQGMIRDFWNVRGKRTLLEEIEEIKNDVQQTTRDAIDAARDIGNFGAHMEEDISLNLDVEPYEAQMLISLIERLFEDWYVTRHEKNKRLAAIVDVAKNKKAKRDAAVGKSS